MAIDKVTVTELARLAGIEIASDELDEVTNRFSSLMQEMDRLKEGGISCANSSPVALGLGPNTSKNSSSTAKASTAAGSSPAGC